MKRADENEDALVLKAIAGDALAFEELVRRRQSWMRSLLLRLTNDANISDDLCQEAFLKAWRNIDRVMDQRFFGAWLRKIAVHTWVDYLRSRRMDIDDVDVDGFAAPALAGGVNTADYRMDLSAAIANLKPGPRACVVLFFGEGMTHPEIAAATGLTIGVVKSHIARSKPRLRKYLVDWSNHE